jgi:hypothetical protein
LYSSRSARYCYAINAPDCTEGIKNREEGLGISTKLLFIAGSALLPSMFRYFE